MPVAARRRIRESVFGAGHDATGSIRERSQSGAITSTAPHGTGRPLRIRPKRRGSLPKVAAGLIVLAAIGVAGWSYLTSDDATIESVDDIEPLPPRATTTVADVPTVEPPVRTGITASSPVVLPTRLLPLDTVSVDPPAPRSSAAILSDPSGATLWMAEVDGAVSGAFGLEVSRIGAIDVGIDPSREDDGLTSYRLVVPCGFVLVTEGIAQPFDRPSTIELFESMSVDDDASIDVNLPPEWSLLDVGPIARSYTAVFRIDSDDDDPDTPDDVVTMIQVPDGSIAQLAGNGRRLATTSFLGGPAYIDSAPVEAGDTTILWSDRDTAFSISSTTLDAAALADFVEAMEPATTDEWQRRFGIGNVETPEPVGDCSPQPRFGATLDP